MKISYVALYVIREFEESLLISLYYSFYGWWLVVLKYYWSAFNCLSLRTTFSPGLNAGIPKYGQLEQRNASHK